MNKLSVQIKEIKNDDYFIVLFAWFCICNLKVLIIA